MYILIIKSSRTAYLSMSKRSLADKSGVNYHNLVYYNRKGYFENENILFTTSDVIKSKQGGKRKTQNNEF